MVITQASTAAILVSITEVEDIQAKAMAGLLQDPLSGSSNKAAEDMAVLRQVNGSNNKAVMARPRQVNGSNNKVVMAITRLPTILLRRTSTPTATRTSPRATTLVATTAAETKVDRMHPLLLIRLNSLATVPRPTTLSSTRTARARERRC